MATITDAKLAVEHDHSKKLVTVSVNCKVNFTGFERSLMNNTPREKLFKLKCELWGEEKQVISMPVITSSMIPMDEQLFTFTSVKYFPDTTPTSSESVTFSTTLGEGILEEDRGINEIYGRFILSNLFSGNLIIEKTNLVKHSF